MASTALQAYQAKNVMSWDLDPMDTPDADPNAVWVELVAGLVVIIIMALTIIFS